MVSPRALRHRTSGVALITVLGLVVLATVLIVALFSLAGSDRRRARSFLEVMKARMLIESASEEVLAKIVDGSEVPWANGRAFGSTTASPGMMESWRYDLPYNRADKMLGANAFATNGFWRQPFAGDYPTSATGSGGKSPANPRLLPLFSWRWFAPISPYLSIKDNAVDPASKNPDYIPAAVFNLNTVQNPFYPGQLYLSGLPATTAAVKSGPWDGDNAFNKANADNYRFQHGEAAIDRPLFVQWLPVFDNPKYGPTYTNTNGAVVKNKIVGRYAYWVDVENTKVNLNTATRAVETDEIAALTGEADAVASGSGRFFKQSGGGYATSRLAYEGKMPVLTGTNFTTTRDGSANTRGDNSAAVAYRDLALGWRGPSASESSLPTVADNSLVDWRVFVGMRPKGDGSDSQFVLQNLRDGYQPVSEGPLDFMTEAYSLLDPKIAETDPDTARARLDGFRRTFMLSTTIYGFDEERDPLGKEKIDLVLFQREGVNGGAWNELWNRLSNTNYHPAYKPFETNYATNRSFAQSLNSFAGTMDRNTDTNGEWAVRQMLVNIVSYGANDPPLPTLGSGGAWSDKGIWPHKSMPYVAEIATRARSAMWQLPQATRTNLTTNDFIRDAGGTYFVQTAAIDGKPPSFYLTNVTVDLAVGFVNPNIYETNSFSGQLELDYSWKGAAISTSLPISGRYVPRPLPVGSGSDNHSVSQSRRASFLGLTAAQSASDTNAYLDLGPISGEMLVTNGAALTNDTLLVRGWRVTKNGADWHRVPLNHPGVTGTPVEWWKMAMPNYWTGATNHPHSLQEYHNRLNTNLSYFENGALKTNQTRWGFRPVGWFTPESMQAVGVTNLFILMPAGVANGTTPFATSTNDASYKALANLIAYNKKESPALVDRVYSLDPALGHRTINTAANNPVNRYRIGGGNSAVATDPAVDSGNLTGHFYGMTGHTWRRVQNAATVNTIITTTTTNVTTTLTGTTQQSYTYYVSDGVGLRAVTGTVDVPTYTTNTNVITSSGVSSTGGTYRSLLHPFLAASATNFVQDRYGLESGNTGFYRNVLIDPPLLRGSTGSGSTTLIDREGTSADAANSTTVPSSYVGVNDEVSLDGTGHGNISYFAGVDRGEPMTSIGEIGFVHSGFPQRPIQLTPGAGTNSSGQETARQIFTHPELGPQASMLVDIFTPGAFRDQKTFPPRSKAAFAQSGTGANPSNSPMRPRRGTWNMNLGVASDSYMAIRQGDYTAAPSYESGFSRDVNGIPSHLVWAPNGIGKVRSITSAKERTNLDPFLSPLPRFRRGWEGWMSAITGDWTVFRTGTRSAWTSGSTDSFSKLGLPPFTWNVGAGGDFGTSYAPYPVGTGRAIFDTEVETAAKFLTFGDDGRQAGGNGGFGNPQSAALANNAFADSQRYGIWPMRHKVSDLIAADVHTLTTMLNPEIATSAGGGVNARNYPGSFFDNGIFANGPMAMIANQVTASANAFTIHVVAQAIKDVGRPIAGIDHSGVGWHDLDDQVTAEQWAQIVVAKMPRLTGSGTIETEASGKPINDYKILYYRVLDNPK